MVVGWLAQSEKGDVWRGAAAPPMPLMMAKSVDGSNIAYNEVEEIKMTLAL